jgi:5-methylcytosine-specific restriction protein A
MSTARTMMGGWTAAAKLPRGANGRALCRWCSLEVPRGRRTFCSVWCVDQWRIRTDPGYLRERVFARDAGRCAICRIDTVEAYRRLKRARGKCRDAMLAYWGAGALKRRSLWDADHILPVCEGGGECDLENLRTLCLVCHQDATSALRRRRARATSPLAAGVQRCSYLPMPEKSTLGGCAAAGVAVK